MTTESQSPQRRPPRSRPKALSIGDGRLRALSVARTWLSRILPLVALLVVIGPGPVAAEVRLPEMIRVRLSVSGQSLSAVLPEGSGLAVDGAPFVLPEGASTLGIAPAGWRLGISTTSPMPLLALAGEPAVDGLLPAGLFRTRAAAERARRILRSEFGTLPTVAQTGWHISLNASILRDYPVRLELAVGPETDATLTLNGRRYRGSLLMETTGAGFVVTNTLALEQYLYSVVGSEMPSTWELEALKAQAVAARTYALRQIDAAAAYDICDSTACQAYAGTGAETASVREAVDATRGIVATYDGEPIDAVYSANMGGQTAASEDVWSNRVPYLRPVASPQDALALESAWAAADYEWVVDLTPGELLDGLRGRGYDLSALEGIQIVADDGFGRAVALEIRGRPQNLTVYRDEIRYALGIKSTAFSVSTSDERRERHVVGAPGIAAERARAGTPVGGFRRSVAFEEVPAPYRLNNGSVFLREILIPESIVINGRGVGHGVGMSQWGAQGMAIEGSDYEEILKHFFTGIELTRAA